MNVLSAIGAALMYIGILILILMASHYIFKKVRSFLKPILNYKIGKKK